MTSLVEGLKCHAAGHGTIAYDGYDAIFAFFQVFCDGYAKAGRN